MGDRPDSAERSAEPTRERSIDPDATGRRSIGGSLRGLESVIESPTRVARGGASVVYRAFHRRLGQPVAVKVLDERHARDPKVRRRFEREATVLAGLRTERIVRVLDRLETEDGRPVLIMEWIDGTDVERRIRSHGPLPYPLAAAIVRDVASALACAHRAGVVHRDVKPSNVVLVDRGDGPRAVLLDFGIAADADERDTATGATLGTPAFMPPEQARDAGRVSAAADVYSAGALFYTMVVGEPPHGRGDAWSQLHRVAEGYRASLVDAAPFVPRAVAELFDRCLSHDATERPADGSELLTALDAASARRVEAARARPSPAAALAVGVVATIAAGALGARITSFDPAARSLVTGVSVVLALLAVAGLALRERARFSDASFAGRLDRLFVEAAPRAAFATTLALATTGWIAARGILPIDPARASLAVGLGAFVLFVRRGTRPERGQIGRIEIPTSRSSASSLLAGSSGGRSTSSSPRVRGTIGSSSPS